MEMERAERSVLKRGLRCRRASLWSTGWMGNTPIATILTIPIVGYMGHEIDRTFDLYANVYAIVIDPRQQYRYNQVERPVLGGIPPLGFVRAEMVVLR